MSSSLLSQSVASIDILHHLRLMSILSISFGIINIDVWGVNDTYRSGDDRPAPSSLKGVSHVSHFHARHRPRPAMSPPSTPASRKLRQIGRASCRERVCQYV